MTQRLDAQGTWSTTVGENLSYMGLSKTGRDHVILLMVDSGVPSRGHRVNIFKPEYVNAGVDFGTHATYGAVSCTDFSGGYTLTSAQACATPACAVTSPAASFTCTVGSGSTAGPSPTPDSSTGGATASDGLNGGAIAGIVIGTLVCVGGGLFALWWFGWHKAMIWNKVGTGAKAMAVHTEVSKDANSVIDKS